VSRGRQRTCRGKRRYHDHAQAIRVLHLLASRSERGKIPTRAYYCPDCNGWHLTSQARRTGA
jgi:hypothetical protein